LNDFQKRTPSAAAGSGWHTMTFRWLSVYAVTFAVSVMVLIGFIGWSVTGKMEVESDHLMRWEMSSFDSIADHDLLDAIQRRMEHAHVHASYFGLFKADGTRIAGDILAVPPGIAFVAKGGGLSAPGFTLNHTLPIQDTARSPVVRVMAEHRADGSQLVIARDLSDILRIREATLNALIGGGILFLLAGVATGLLLSMRQMRRVRDIHRVTLRIAEGDLNQRLPTGGRDELDMLTHLVNHMLDEIERLMNEVKGACDGIAHDLRTPLSHIRTLLGNVAGRMRTFDDDSATRMLDQARLETDVLLDRFRAMLRISEIGSLRRRGGFSSVDLSSLVREVSELYEPLAEDRCIRLSLKAGNVPTINGDRALLFEAFSNLLDNAIKFAPEHGEVRIDLMKLGQGAQLVVSDNGPGIPKREREAVLQRFYRGDQVRHLAGSGLGLSVVSAVIRLHDFALRIGENGEGAGTSMTIECWSHAFN
jgi:signal transduction histidine kinase